MSGEGATYPYDDAATFPGPRAYHFAPFGGPEFLEAYRASRLRLRRQLEGTARHAPLPAMRDADVDGALRRFEVHGRCGKEVAAPEEEARLAAMLWMHLARRCGSKPCVRTLNCMLKLGDFLARQASLLDATSAAAAMFGVDIELKSVAIMQTYAVARARSGNQSWGGHTVCSERTSRCDEPPATHHRFGMLAAETSRSRAYLQMMARTGLRPGHVIVVDDGGNSPSGVADIVKSLGVSHEVFRGVSINDAAMARAVAHSGLELFVYSGPPGVKVGRQLLRAGAELLHVHAGRLPQQRGSTTTYYSLLEEGVAWASAIVLAEQLDRGAVVAQRCYAPPEDGAMIDHEYDARIRADLLARVLRRYVQLGALPRLPQALSGVMHYVMHPVLRHVVILASGMVEQGHGPHGAGAECCGPPSPCPFLVGRGMSVAEQHLAGRRSNVATFQL